MRTYLFQWNPKLWPWDELPSAINEIKLVGFYDEPWNCANTKAIRKGDRAFLLRVGAEPRGIFASGEVVSDVRYEDRHWDKSKPGKLAWYVKVRFEALLNPDGEPILPLERLLLPDLAAGPWRVLGNGKSIPPPVAATLERVWAEFLGRTGLSPVFSADEVPTPERFFEGATKPTMVNRYERSPAARKACIEHYGTRCVVCGFDFRTVYGERGEGYIHVHHLKSLAEIGKEYVIDPIADLRPVCPNCHAMIHALEPMLRIEALKALIQKHARRS
jgi:5-methylcytosine-specific restriction protein A